MIQYVRKNIWILGVLAGIVLTVSGVHHYYQLIGRVLGTTTCDITVTSDAQLSAANANVLAGQTVCIDSGTYFTSISPARSGTSDSNRITYQASSGATVILKQMINLSSKSYVTVTGISVISTTAASRYVDMSGGSHDIIDDVDMSSGAALTPGTPPINLSNASYCVVRNSHIYGADDHYNDAISLLNNSHHNLIENNRFDEGSHSNLLAQGDGSVNPSNPPRFNIIRNNHFFNAWHHCINMMYGVHDNVFEDNVFEQCGSGLYSDPYDTRAYRDGAGDYGDFHAWEDNSIYRRNIFMNSGDWDSTYNNHAGFFTAVSSSYPVNSLPMLATVRYNHFYNNVVYGNWGPAFKVGIYARATPDLTGFHDNKFVNNILYNNGTNGSLTKQQVKYQVSNGGAGTPADPPGEEWRNNIIGDPGDLAFNYSSVDYTITDAALIAKFAAFTGNLSGNPGFVASSRNAATADFHLQNNSIAKDSGDFLTKTTQACSGNTVTVQDARFFIDGYGIVPPDQIQIENGAVYTISSIDYNTNIITTTTTTSCLAGKGVALPYQGIKPDIGVFESTAAGITPTLTPTSTPPANCFVTGSGFSSHALTPMAGTFTATFDVTPENDETGISDSTVGFAQGQVSYFTDFSANIRFNNTGKIDARNGSTYVASTTPFTEGLSYHFRFVINVPNRTYAVYVTPAGGSESQLGVDNMAFRPPTAPDTYPTQIDNWGTGITTGTVTVCNASVNAILPTSTSTPYPTLNYNPIPTPPNNDPVCS